MKLTITSATRSFAFLVALFGLLGCLVKAQDTKDNEVSERKLVREAHETYELDVQRAKLEYDKAIKKAKAKLSSTYDLAVNQANKKGVAGNKLADELTAEKDAFDIYTSDEDEIVGGNAAASHTRKQILAKLTKSRWRASWEPTTAASHLLDFKLDGSLLSDQYRKAKYKLERRWVLEYYGDLVMQMNDEHWKGFVMNGFREANLKVEK